MTAHNFAPVEISAQQGLADIERLANTIDYRSMVSIHEFGSEISARTASYTDEILASAKVSELDQTGERLNEIVVAAQEFSFKEFGGPMSRVPVLGALLNRVKISKEKAIARFEVVKTQIDKLVNQVDQTADQLNRRSLSYQSMYDGVRQEFELLGLHVAAIERRLQDVDTEVVQLQGKDDAMDTTEHLAMLEASRNALTKRADDLRVLTHSALQMLPMVRIIQSNNLTLVDKFQTIRLLTLPAWKRSFMLALALDEQKNAVELATTIDDATNELMRRNADLLHQSSVATAKANQRLVIDPETLRHVHEKIIATLRDVRTAHETGADERRKAIADLERMRGELVNSYRAIELKKAS
jgi:uncharacterized protein YaaN involved in tellurite resistance